MSCALYTIPMPPRPSSSRMRYLDTCSPISGCSFALLAGVQDDFLHPPVGQLSNIKGIRVPAIDLVGGAELLRQFARRTEPSHYRAIQLHFVDLAAIHRIGRIGVRAEQVLVRAL